MAEERIVILQNPTSFAREEWTRVPVPFDPGEFPGGGGGEPPPWSLAGLPTAWQPFGARWPDGSVRHAVAMALVRLAPNEERSVVVEPRAGPPLEEPFRPAAAVAAWEETWPLEILAEVEEKTHRAVMGPPRRVLEEGPARRVTLHVARIPDTMLLLEAVLCTYAGQELVPFDLAVYCSDPRVPDMVQPVDSLRLRVRGALPLVRFWMARGVRPGESPPEGEDLHELVLLRRTHFGDGQGQRWAGSLLHPPLGHEGEDLEIRRSTLAAETRLPLLQAARWKGTRAFGPFGVVPDAPPWLAADGGRSTMTRRARDFLRRLHRVGDPWEGPTLGLLKAAGSSGDQADFGVIKVWPTALTGIPSFLLEVEHSVLQEACRPVHFFEADGEPVQPEDHPDWVVWTGRTHWHAGVSRDRLGKPSPEPKADFHGFTGKPNQHWSSLYLCGFHLLSGSFGALRQIQNEARLYLASQTLRAGLSTSGPDAPRAVGRTLLTASWIYLCTGDERVRRRMVDRIEGMLVHVWAGKDHEGKPVRPIGLEGPDARLLDGETVAWLPWQEGIAATGLAAAHRATGSAAALDLAREVSRSVSLHGYTLRGDGTVQVAQAMRWKEGEALTAEELGAGLRRDVVWADGTDFALWAMPAVVLGERFARESGDAAWRARCQEILARLRRRRAPPGDGWFDRFGEWEAIE